MAGQAFTEHEHKFLVGADFDADGFSRRVEALKPRATKRLHVRDTYLELDAHPHLIFRHRLDAELEQLTVKTRGGDNESRLEVNLDLIPGSNQGAAVQAFLGAAGAVRANALTKDLRVFEFADCEIVHYVASYRERTCRCVEIEAIQAPTREAALATIARYEALLGFDAAERCRVNLYDLLINEVRP